MRNLRSEIIPILSKTMMNLGIEENDWLSLIGNATDSSHGDIALPCHSLSRILRKSPNIIADDISSDLTDKLSNVATTTSINGFVNFKATNFWLSNQVSKINFDSKLGVKIENKKTIIIDYSSPNVAKRMHVGHLRSTVIGDALARILTYKGHRVIGENHIGDWGTPFGMLIEHFLECEDVEVKDIDLKNFYKDARYKFDNSKDFAIRSRERVVKLQSKEPETIVLWKELVDISLLHFNEVYRMLDVLLNDDNLAGESIYEDLLPEVVDRLSNQDMIEESDGALVVFPEGWLNREKEPLPLIIRKGDGGYNYATSDLACIINRVENIGGTEFLYVVGAEQSQHFDMVFQVARQANFMDDSIKSVHIPFGLVVGSDGKKLASRDGEAISLKELLEESIVRANKSILEKNPDISESERAEISRMIGIGSVKYADLSVDRNKNYVFDWDKMLSFEGNTAPYLQYAHARICSIFRKASIQREDFTNNEISIMNDNESSLSKTLIGFSAAIDESINNYAPHRLAVYLHKLAQDFASFYENCPVLVIDDKSTMNSRLALCSLTARTLSTGLNLLGIDSPERM
ncbi:TPA: arginine--tRNA ligase [Candidatus Thalassarchaeaceae archaeon]|jgi:arginyl-tRNA synthetase|nr:arginine--tRNA ligase [Euryarchaeota archaeon]MDG1548279.1 arginine--tRNA ligase [Candidatus Thalassarchaeaceae archaeon]DAC63644.1 MAG TPA: arginine--tRNA ligase [Candidatus Poseidoniales archaeon]MDG1553508.1 arginine--tRNA ligase [Candidatus Thalassarchaeaceae archaeon]DAC65853.1 MAG TPA: arginine--tRNA ligase [Candidatus Poseidoniales archaeon]